MLHWSRCSTKAKEICPRSRFQCNIPCTSQIQTVYYWWNAQSKNETHDWKQREHERCSSLCGLNVKYTDMMKLSRSMWMEKEKKQKIKPNQMKKLSLEINIYMLLIYESCAQNSCKHLYLNWSNNLKKKRTILKNAPN